MARIALAVGAAAAGIVAGWFTSNPLIGFEVFSAVEGIGNALIGPKTKVGPPQLSDSVVSNSTNGAPIPFAYGGVRLAGQIIWSSGIEQQTVTTSQSAKGMPGATQTSYVYTCSFAAAFCEGPANITRIWGDSKLIYDTTGKGAVTSDTFDTGIGTNTEILLPTIYTGTATQEPDPTIQAAMGIDSTPAFRNLCYLVYEKFPLADFGNRLPNIRAELSTGTVQAYIKDTYPPSGISHGGSLSPAAYCAVDQINRVGFLLDLNTYTIQRIDLSADNTEPPNAWQASTAYTVGEEILDSNGNIEVCIQAGTSGTTQPSPWPTTETTVTNDHTVKWQNAGGGPDAIVVTAKGTLNPILHASETITSDPVSVPMAFGVDTGGYLWNSVEIGSQWYLCKYDPFTFACVGRVAIAAPAAAFGFVRISGTNWLYATTQPQFTGGGVIYIVDTHSLRISSSCSWIPSLNSMSTSGPAFPAIDPKTGVAYVITNTGGASPYDYYVTVCDPRSGAVVPSAQHFTGNATIGVGKSCLYDPIDQTLLVLTTSEAIVKISVSSWSVSVTTAAGFFLDTSDGAIPHSYYGQVPPAGILYLQDQSTPANMIAVNHLTLAVQSTTLLSSWFVTGGWSGTEDMAFDPITTSMLMEPTNAGNYAGLSYRIYLNRQTVAGETLDQIVADICERAGMASSQFDVTQLASTTALGYPVTRNTDGKSIIQPLQMAYFFDAAETDFKLVFIPRGGASAMSIPEGDLGLASDGYELVPTIAQEHDLPKEVSITYADPALNYQPGKQKKARPARIVKTKNKTILQLPLTLDSDTAMEICDKALRSMWDERNQFDFKLWRASYLVLDPADIVTFTYEGLPFVSRLTKVTMGQDYSQEISGVSEDPKNYVSVLPGAPTQGFDSGQINPLAPTMLFFMDMPLLEDTDAPPAGSTGYYFAMGSPSVGWPGAVLLSSPDDENYAQVGAAVDEIGYGIVSAATPAPPSPGGPEVWDTTTQIVVRMVEGTPPASTSQINVLNGANAFILNGEVIQYQTAVQNADGSYTLSNLLRGRRGTELACATHVTGESALFLPAGLHRNIVPTSLVGLARFYKAVTIGTAASGVVSDDVTLAGNDLKPYFPCQIAGTRDVSHNLIITWLRRTRIGGENDWQDGVTNVPLSEASEQYSVDILNGTTVVRTFNGLTSPTVTYTAAEQTTDFGSAQSSVSIVVYQISADVGRGFPAAATV